MIDYEKKISKEAFNPVVVREMVTVIKDLCDGKKDPGMPGVMDVEIVAKSDMLLIKNIILDIVYDKIQDSAAMAILDAELTLMLAQAGITVEESIG